MIKEKVKQFRKICHISKVSIRNIDKNEILIVNFVYNFQSLLLNHLYFLYL